MVRGLIYSISSFLSAIAGFAIITLIAWQFGISQDADVFFISFRFSMTLVALVTSIVGITLLPSYQRQKSQSIKEGNLFGQRIFFSSTCILILITLTLFLTSTKLEVLLLPPQEGHANQNILFSTLFPLSTLHFLFSSLAVIPGTILIANGKIITAGILNNSPIVFPLVYCLLPLPISFETLFLTYVMGGFFSTLLHIYLFLRTTGVSRNSFLISRTELNYMRRSVPWAISDVATRFIPLLERLIVATISPGMVIAIEIANRFYLRSVTLACSGQVLFFSSEIADNSAKHERAALSENLTSSLMIIISIGCVLTTFLLGSANLIFQFISAGSIPAPLFQEILICYSCGVIILSANDVIRRTQISVHLVALASSINVFQALTNLASLYLLVPKLGILAIPLAYSASVTTSFAISLLSLLLNQTVNLMQLSKAVGKALFIGGSVWGIQSLFLLVLPSNENGLYGLITMAALGVITLFSMSFAARIVNATEIMKMEKSILDRVKNLP